MELNILAFFTVVFLALLGKLLVDVVRKAYDGARSGSWWGVVTVAVCVGLAVFVPDADVFAAFGIGTLYSLAARVITGVAIAGGAAGIYRLLRDAKTGRESVAVQQAPSDTEVIPQPIDEDAVTPE